MRLPAVVPVSDRGELIHRGQDGSGFAVFCDLYAIIGHHHCCHQFGQASLGTRYSGAPNLEIFLKGHAGDLLRVNRKSRAREFVEHPTLALGLAVQPEVLRDIAQMPGFRGKGLLARILFSVPANTVGHRTPGANLLDQQAVATYGSELTSLALALADLPDPAALTLTPEADQRVLALEWAAEPRLAPSGAWVHVADWAPSGSAQSSGLPDCCTWPSTDTPVGDSPSAQAASTGSR